MTYEELQARVRQLEAQTRAGAAIRRRQELTQVLLDNITSLVVVKDAGGRYLLVNNKGEEVIGLKREEIVGKTVEEVYPPEIAEKILAVDRKVLESGEIQITEERLRQDDGRVYYTTKVPLFDENGDCWGLCGLATDITERKKSELRLKEDEEMVKTILNTSAEPMLLLDTEGLIIYLNETAALRFGKPIAELVGLCCFDLFSPELAESRRNYHGIVIQYAMPVRFEESWGGIIFATTIYPVLDARGKVVRLSEWARDISVQKQSEEALREREEKYRALFECMQDAAFLADAVTGMIREANPQAEILMGYTRDELVTMHQTELHPREETERYQSIFLKRTEEGPGVDSDCEIVRKDGARVPVVISAQVLTIGGNSYLLGIFRDQTLDRKLAGNKEKARHLRKIDALAREAARESNTILFNLLDELGRRMGSDKLSGESRTLLAEVETGLRKVTELNRKILEQHED